MAKLGRPEALVGRVIADKYKVEALLGLGGMGAVYRARHAALSRTVAVKVVRPDDLEDRSFASRFRREAKAASMLEHKNSLRVLDFGQEPDGLFYLVMELLDGRDLGRVLHEDFPLTSERIVDILSQVLAALAVAHDQGILHRDLKPENVMVVAGSDDEGARTEVVKVCDFGLAKMMEKDKERPPGMAEGELTATGTLTAHGVLVGTPEYMSPEQVMGLPLDARCDLYGVGAVLYQMLAGRPPFEATSVVKLAMKQVEEAPEPPSALQPGVDAKLEAICLRALKKSPDERFANAREMRAELRAAVDLHGASSTHMTAVAAASSLTSWSGPAATEMATSGGVRAVPSSGTLPPSPRDAPDGARRAPSRLLLILLALGLVLAGAAVGALLTRR